MNSHHHFAARICTYKVGWTFDLLTSYGGVNVVICVFVQ